MTLMSDDDADGNTQACQVKLAAVDAAEREAAKCAPLRRSSVIQNNYLKLHTMSAIGRSSFPVETRCDVSLSFVPSIVSHMHIQISAPPAAS